MGCLLNMAGKLAPRGRDGGRSGMSPRCWPGRTRGPAIGKPGDRRQVTAGPGAKTLTGSGRDSHAADQPRLQGKCPRRPRRPEAGPGAGQHEGRFPGQARRHHRQAARSSSGCARRAGRSRTTCWSTWTGTLSGSSRRSPRTSRPGSISPRTAQEAREAVLKICQDVGREDRHQGQVDGGGGDRPQRPSRGQRPGADRDRPRRIHHPAAPRVAEPHHRAPPSTW